MCHRQPDRPDVAHGAQAWARNPWGLRDQHRRQKRPNTETPWPVTPTAHDVVTVRGEVRSVGWIASLTTPVAISPRPPIPTTTPSTLRVFAWFCRSCRRV